MAGGEGSRLRPMTANLPKPLLPVANRPIMEHVLRLLRRHGFDETVVTVQFLASLVRNYFGDGEELGMALQYATEQRPLGTAGSVKNAEDALRRRALPRHLRGRAHRHRPAGDGAVPPRAGGAGHGRLEVRAEPPRVRHRHHRRGRPHRPFPGEAHLGPGVLGHRQHRHLRDGARGARPRAGGRGGRLVRATCSPRCCAPARRCTGTSQTATGRTSGPTRATSRRTRTCSTARSTSTSTASRWRPASGWGRAPRSTRRPSSRAPCSSATTARSKPARSCGSTPSSATTWW